MATDIQDSERSSDRASIGTGLPPLCPDVEAEIRALPSPADAGYRAAVARAEAPETLVHGIRSLLRSGNTDGAQALLVILIQRATPTIAGHLRRLLGTSAADHDDAAQEVTIRMWHEVQDISPHREYREYWVRRFARKLRLCCIDAAKDIYRRRQRERPFARGEDDEGEAWDEEANLADPVTIDTELLVPEALAQLSGKYREAMALHLLGYQATSNDPAEPTIAGRLSVTDRSVRTYLRRGEEIIRVWYASRAAADAGVA